MEIPIHCPGCGHRFKLKTPNPGVLMTKTFQCPKCGAASPFSRLLGEQGAATPPPIAPGAGAHGGMSTHLGGTPGDKLQPGGMAGGPQARPYNGGLHTHLGGQPGGQPGGMADAPQARPYNGGHTQMHGNVAQAVLTVPSLRRQFPLAPGEYILGRDSSDSQANVRLAPDMCMSRRHAHLYVQPGPGGIPVATLTGLQSRNDIFINNTRIYAGTSVRLNPGDEILLGNTVIRYLLK